MLLRWWKKEADGDGDDDELLLWDDGPMNSRKSYVQKGPSSGSLTIVTSQHAQVGIDPAALTTTPRLHNCSVNLGALLFCKFW